MNQLANVFKILADENRLRMIVLLYQEELCVCELSGILDIPQPRVSQNLSRLRDLNLVDDVRKEKFVFYSLRRDSIILTDILQHIIEDMDAYPQFIVDKSKLKDKSKYSNQCCVIND